MRIVVTHPPWYCVDTGLRAKCPLVRFGWYSRLTGSAWLARCVYLDKITVSANRALSVNKGTGKTTPLMVQKADGGYGTRIGLRTDAEAERRFWRKQKGARRH